MSEKLRILDLFSGIGGFSLGLERTGGFETVAFCEIDPFCRAVLAKHWPNIPCHDDITTREFTKGEADVICGGFPCQDISIAGNRAGITGKRSGLYREMVRAIRVVRPAFALMENVADLLSLGMGVVLGDLAEGGHDAEWDCISAHDAGAPHGRDRVWIAVTDAYEFKRPKRSGFCAGWWLWQPKEVEAARNANGQWELQPPRLLGNVRRWIDNAARSRAWWARNWQEEFAALRGMDDGVPTRLDRSEMSSGVAALGNAVVTIIPEAWGHAILQAQEQMRKAA